MNSFYERPILNSPYRAPALHHPLDTNGQLLGGEPRPGRRPSRFIVPVPASRKKASAAQASLDLETYTERRRSPAPRGARRRRRDEAELDDIYETERRRLYVACTRAREHLLLTGVTPTSEYLADFIS